MEDKNVESNADKDIPGGNKDSTEHWEEFVASGPLELKNYVCLTRYQNL